MVGLVRITLRLLADILHLAISMLRPARALATENLVFRRQLALYRERGIKPRRVDPATRASLAFLTRFIDWRGVVIVVRPETIVRWHRAGFRLFWRWKSRTGRPPIPIELRRLIRRMAIDNPLWGEERIANELLVKLGLQVSPRTVRKYMPKRPPGLPRGGQRWSSFLRNQAKAILACDFLVAVTVTFKMFYVFVVIEHGARRLLHFNLTQHPTAQWTLRQLREVVSFRDGYRYLLRDRDSIYSRELDRAIEHLGLKTVRSPPRSPKANAICERVIGTIRRECLDWVIPVSEAHLRVILREWVTHYNRARPHSALGPGIPDSPATLCGSGHGCTTRQRFPEPGIIRARAVLGGLHHEYSWATECH